MQSRYWGCLVQPQHHDVWTEYEIEKPLANAEGGEGGIFTLKPHAGERRVAKLYNPASKSLLNPEAFRSLAVLTSKYADYSQSLPFVAWPIEVLFTVKHPSSIQHLPTLAGITMRHISGHAVLEKITTNGNGRFGIGTEKAVRIAAVIANYLTRLHNTGIIFCDFNPKNILVSNDHSNVTFVDADAFQHSIITNVFTKPHYFPGYASPNHIDGKPGPRHSSDDDFVLAIHIFQLLLDGGHPFDTGPAYNPTGDPFATITPHDNIKARRWPYSDIAKYHPPGETPKHYAKLHPELRAMFERAFQKHNPPTAAEWEAVLPKYRNNVEGTAPPPIKPAAQPAPAPKPAAPQPARQKPPVATPYAPPQPAHYAYHHALNIPPPAPQPAPSPPPTLKDTAKAIAKAIAWWLAINLWRLFKMLLLWLLKQGRVLAIASAKGFRKHGGVEATVGVFVLVGIFWYFRTYDAQLAAKQTQSALAAQPPAPTRADRPFKTTIEAARPPAALPPQKKSAPRKPEAEPEILPWLTKEVPAPKAEPLSAPDTRPKRRIYPRNFREYQRMRRQRQERADNSGWTRRGRASEFRLAPGATPILRITPSQ